MSIMNNTGVNLNALFLGPKSENEDFFLKELVRLFEDHAQWRKNYQPGDEEVIKTSFKNYETFIDTSEKCEEVLKELSRRLRAGATPWHSPRYLGQMRSPDFCLLSRRVRQRRFTFLFSRFRRERFSPIRIH